MPVSSVERLFANNRSWARGISERDPRDLGFTVAAIGELDAAYGRALAGRSKDAFGKLAL